MSEASVCLLDRDDGSPASELAKHLSEISEKCWAARWLDGVEYFAWTWLAEERVGPVSYGMGTVHEEDLAALRKLSALAGGWVYWLEHDDPAEEGVRFVPLARWQEMYREAMDDD